MEACDDQQGKKTAKMEALNKSFMAAGQYQYYNAGKIKHWQSSWANTRNFPMGI